jgi:hypothetical protein
MAENSAFRTKPLRLAASNHSPANPRSCFRPESSSRMITSRLDKQATPRRAVSSCPRNALSRSYQWHEPHWFAISFLALVEKCLPTLSLASVGSQAANIEQRTRAVLASETRFVTGSKRRMCQLVAAGSIALGYFSDANCTCGLRRRIVKFHVFISIALRKAIPECYYSLHRRFGGGLTIGSEGGKRLCRNVRPG